MVFRRGEHFLPEGLARKGQPLPPIHHADSWAGQIERAVLWGCSSGKRLCSEERQGWTFRMRSRPLLLPGGTSGPSDVGEPGCFCLHVSTELTEWVCMYVYVYVFACIFSFTFYVKCTYLTKGFTFLWEQCQNGELVLWCLRTSCGWYTCYCTLGSRYKGCSFSGTQMNWEGHFVHRDSHLDMFVRLSTFPQFWASSYFCGVVVSQ